MRLGVPWGIRDNGGHRVINIKGTLLFLLPSAFMLLLVACGGTAAPSVDIEATIEARVAEERAAAATV